MGTGGRLCETQVQNSVLSSTSSKALDKLLITATPFLICKMTPTLQSWVRRNKGRKTVAWGLALISWWKKKKWKTTIAVLIITGLPDSEDSEMKSSRPVWNRLCFPRNVKEVSLQNPYTYMGNETPHVWSLWSTRAQGWFNPCFLDPTHCGSQDLLLGPGGPALLATLLRTEMFNWTAHLLNQIFNQ